MEKTIPNAFVLTKLSANHLERTRIKTKVFTKFFAWCKAQEPNRFLWIAITLFGLIGLIMPYTLLSILFIGNQNLNLFLTICAVNVPVFALYLAAQPTKVTLPAFFLTVAIDVFVMLYSFVYFLYH